MVRERGGYALAVSVLALSSRFDGQLTGRSLTMSHGKFQYSLCRVVLMVTMHMSYQRRGIRVSVLALSSRFDGPPQ